MFPYAIGHGAFPHRQISELHLSELQNFDINVLRILNNAQKKSLHQGKFFIVNDKKSNRKIIVR